MPSGNSSSANSTATHGNATATTTIPPPSPTVPPPPIPVQPYTVMAPGGFPVGAGTPLPLPTTPALFPQNISTCSTCYGMFPTLSRCNVIANSDTFPITPNTTYQSLLPFLKCICTFKALEAQITLRIMWMHSDNYVELHLMATKCLTPVLALKYIRLHFQQREY
ncbi:hypothetical protein BGZ76_008800 [Entomortierella beljakovae]|nr:hypothetical protein BGZ76_008800 [Entomortierella beljakovae]